MTVRMTRFDIWFFRAFWIGLLAVLTAMSIWIASMAIDIATAGGGGAGRKAGILLALAAVLVVTLAWAAIRTPRQWRAFVDRAADAADTPRAVRCHMFSWLRDTWRETDPANDVVPSAAELPGDDKLRDEGLDDDAIKRLRADPRAFPHTLRRLGFSFGGVRGDSFSARTVGVAHYLWSRLT